MASQPTPIFVRILNLIKPAELVLLVVLLVGLSFYTINNDVTTLRFSLVALGVVWFLMAFRPSDVPRVPGKEDERSGLPELLAETVFPKVLWISSAVCAIGISMYVAGFKGAEQQLLVGGVTAGIASAGMLLFLAMGKASAGHLKGGLLRALPLAIVALNILYRIA